LAAHFDHGLEGAAPSRASLIPSDQAEVEEECEPLDLLGALNSTQFRESSGDGPQSPGALARPPIISGVRFDGGEKGVRIEIAGTVLRLDCGSVIM
jgi:hypothetical protein